jgi:DNA (cytosine-5)-methyltransferase 1
VHAADERKRFLVVTPGNVRQRHLYIRGHYDFFPPDCIGPARKNSDRSACQIEIHLAGLNEVVKTDIPTDRKTGKPRGFFRDRSWVPRFFEHHNVRVGDKLALERLGRRSYRLSPEGSYTAAEFFAGIGLVRLALERQRWQVVFANDIDPDKAEMYRHNWPKDDHLVIGDIHSLKTEDVPTVHLATASFPCNDLSIAGRWEGLNGKQSSAFWGLVRLLREMDDRRPPLLMLENVVGFLMSHGGRDLEQALLALNELGYAMDAVILNAVHWVPQSRARLFLIGKRKDRKECRSFSMQTAVRPKALWQFMAEHPNIVWDIADLPSLPVDRPRLAQIVEDLPDDDPHWWNKKRSDYFINQLSKRHLLEAKRMIRGEKFTFATAFRRVRNEKSMAELRTDGIAGCLRTPRGGSGRQILFKAGNGRFQVRLFTARECARLQGVPDSYLIDVPLNKALFGFGDAVCVPAVEWIVSHYLSNLSFPAANS